MATLDFKATTYSNTLGGTHEAVMVEWSSITALLGHDHDGDGADDEAIVAALVEAGAPGWVRDAEGWIEEDGWGLIGPAIVAEKSRAAQELGRLGGKARSPAKAAASAANGAKGGRPKKVSVEVGTEIGDGYTFGRVTDIERAPGGDPILYVIHVEGGADWRLTPARIRSAPYRVLDPVGGYVYSKTEAVCE